MALILGVDEAGRGPVVGDLILAGVLMDNKKIDSLGTIGVKDSKLLTHINRIKICGKIKEMVDDFRIIRVKPLEIDKAVESKSMNLNWLEARKTAEIINELEPDKVYLDCPSPNIDKYVDYLKDLIEDDSIEIIAKHKADRDFLIVGAASILAKCEREVVVEEIEKMTCQSIGTGYPSNLICQKFLRENWDKYPEIFRKSWVTWRDHKTAVLQKKLDEFN